MDALVVSLAKKARGADSADEGDDDTEDQGEAPMDKVKASAIDELAKAFGVDDFDQEAAGAALEDFVKACMKDYSK